MILVDLIDRIVSIANESEQFATVGKYLKIGKSIKLPACDVEIGDFDIGENPGTEQLEIGARFELRVIVGSEIPNAQEIVRSLAVNIATTIFKEKRLNENCGAWEIVDIEEDLFRPDLSSFLVWLVTIRVPIYNGESVFKLNSEDIITC